MVRGALPWVSNLGPDHLFGTIFEIEDKPGEIVMFLADCSDPAITLTPCQPFLAMDGTGTYGVQFRDVFVADDLILAAPAGPFVKKIRAGFILLQAGMAIGLIRDCIAIMNEVAGPLGHVNRYLPQQPVNFQDLLTELESETMQLARDPVQRRRQLLALRRGASPASGRGERRGRACGDASLRRARLPEEPSRPAQAARGLLRRHRHTRHQAVAQDAGGGVSQGTAKEFRIDPNFNHENRRGLP